MEFSDERIKRINNLNELIADNEKTVNRLQIMKSFLESCLNNYTDENMNLETAKKKELEIQAEFFIKNLNLHEQISILKGLKNIENIFGKAAEDEA